METLQLLNTAIIKRKEKIIRANYEERLRNLQDSPALDILQKAIIQLAEQKNVTRDQAALMIVETVNELENIWSEFIAAEGIDKLKDILKGKQ